VSPRALHLAAPASTATLALVGAAWAATGRLPLTGGGARAPLAISAQATGPLVANDRDGQAILTADALRPGAPTTGEVTISNAGDAPGAFTLSSGGVADGPGALSQVLDLSVRDLTTGANVYTGKLAAFARAPLGTLGVGAVRRYRFELTYPAGRTAAADNDLQGATTSVAFNWDAVAIAAPTPPPPAPAPAPAAPAAPAAPPAAPASSPAGAGRSASTPPATAAPIPATPAPASGPRIALGAGPKPVASGRLVTWMTSTVPARARVTASVTVSGKSYRLKPVTVSLTAKPKTVRLALPPQAAGRRKQLTVRLTVSAGTGRARTTLSRTLRVRTP
jgi:pyruvate dehydrogenase E2 component (dihydrolipoamide acetyltransferase)